MSFSSKIEKPLQSFSPISPSLTLQRKSFAIEQHQQKGEETSSTPLLSQRDKAARVGHHLSQIEISPSAATVQTKLTIGQPGDRYEQEADQVAQQVMTMPEPQILQRESIPAQEEELQAKPLLQRQGLPEEEEELQMKPVASTISPLIQRMETPQEEEELQMQPNLQHQQQSGARDSNTLEQNLSTSKGGGSPLGDDVRTFMEPRFGADFSQVKVHTDSTANQMNQSIQAQAFTHGKDIYFNEGKYSPSTDEGKTLLAHELTHVVQQTGER